MVNKKRLTVYTGLTSDYWDKKKQRVPAKAPFAWEVNEKLDKIEIYLEEIKLEAKFSGIIPSRESIENHIVSIVKPEAPTLSIENEKFVWEYVEVYINRKTGILSEGYLKNWPSLQTHIKEFAPDLLFKDMIPSFQERFAKWLFEVKKLKQNTVSNKITYLHVLARDARKLGYQIAQDFEDYTVKESKNPVFFLHWETDVKAIREVQLIHELDRIRDRFLFRCNTGMREGELKGINKGSFYLKDGQTWLKYYDQKGKKWKQIVLNEEAIQIADKYNRKFPPVSQQEENLLIKQVGLLAGLTKDINVVHQYGARKEHQVVKQYEMITTHTARRTFARRWYELGGDLGLLSRYLGHVERRTTEIYIGLEDVEASREMIRIMG